MSTPAKSSSDTTFFHRLNARFPWLKIVALVAVVAIMAIDFAGLTISRIADFPPALSLAPMQVHPKITERDLENRKLVALTFDDGPSSATTPALLDILKDKQVPATFFMLGSRAASNPDLVRRAEAEGHEIASHTMSHQNLIRISASAAKSDILAATETFENILGHGPAYLRPPYGNFNNTVKTAAGVPLILWSVDTLDWKNRDTDSIVETALSQVHEGAIILMHDVHPTSVEAAPTLIDTLRKEGYEFVTISELAAAHGRELTAGAAYYNFKP